MGPRRCANAATGCCGLAQALHSHLCGGCFKKACGKVLNVEVLGTGETRGRWRPPCTNAGTAVGMSLFCTGFVNLTEFDRIREQLVRQ